jgi:hypothetical protein
MVKLVAALAAVPMSLLAVVAGTGILVVDVREGGPDGHRIVVPVPLVAVQVAASFAPRAATRVDLSEARRYLPVAEDVLRALADAPDGEFVRVEERDEQVVITKRGDVLQVRVHGNAKKEEVAVDLPLSIARELLRKGRDGQLDAADAVGLLRQARLTRLVDVRDGDDHVSVSIW